MKTFGPHFIRSNLLANLASPLVLSMSALAMLSGCSTLLNTAGKGDYGCPGMPMGVVCKTPSAVYRSTHLDGAITEFDTPIDAPSQSEAALSDHGELSVYAKVANAAAATSVSKVATGPRPVREPARVARIWIAQWIDKQDTLHLAQTQYTEIKPRTWTVGKPEVSAGAGYVIPHRAFDGIPVSGEIKPERNDSRVGDKTLPANSQASREASALIAPPN